MGSLLWDGDVLFMFGEWDVSLVGVLNSAVALALLTDHRLQVDMSEVTFVDSSIIAALVLGDREGLDVVLRDPSPIVTRALELTGCFDLFTILRSRDE